MMSLQKTSDRLVNIQDELSQCESLFHHPALDMNRGAVESLIDESFWEIGASGRCYDRAFVVDTLLQRAAGPTDVVWERRSFRCQELAPDNYLLTYILHQGARITRRASIWRRDPGGWKIVFHQGTVIDAV